MNITNQRSLVVRGYSQIFNFLAVNRLKDNDLEPQKIHVQVISTFATSMLMFAYAIIALCHMSDPRVGIVCFITSLIHIGSLGLYRYTPKTNLIASIVLATGVIQTLIFSYFSRGYLSIALNWMGIVPVFAGLFMGLRGAVTWFFITFIAAFSFMVLHLTGHQFPSILSYQGFFWGKSFFIFGFIIMGAFMIIVYTEFNKSTMKILEGQNQKIEDLFRVLFHDLANPLGRLSIGLTLAKKKDDPSVMVRGLEISEEASNTMLEITQNIRNLYALRKGKAGLVPVLSSLSEALEYIESIYARDIKNKSLQLVYDRQKNRGVKVLVEPVSFKNQVLANIISNAIKFSPEGGKIVITVRPENQNHLAIEVSDDGIGMPEHMLQTVFELNKKTSRPGTNGEQGTGFGMYIMKSYMDMFDGEIRVKSAEKTLEKNSGTTVTLILPGEGNLKT
ncbi:MAG TPA: HAMP domain-containing sensor histidine kinase [Bacteriovoracaceae bacterium]|nr:HAMP domain-containing sensor histidine kinase [Bacteriovoracaceae bacterium]